MTNTRHKHYDLIIAFANGEQIQSYDIESDSWSDVKYPIFMVNSTYRIKPKKDEKSKDAQIQKIIDNFSFDLVHKVMLDLDWSYWSVGVPSVDYLKEQAKRQLNDVWEYFEDGSEDRYSVYSGILKATGIREDGLVTLQLDAILCSWDTHHVFEVRN